MWAFPILLSGFGGSGAHVERRETGNCAVKHWQNLGRKKVGMDCRPSGPPPPMASEVWKDVEKEVPTSGLLSPRDSLYLRVSTAIHVAPAATWPRAFQGDGMVPGRHGGGRSARSGLILSGDVGTMAVAMSLRMNRVVLKPEPDGSAWDVLVPALPYWRPHPSIRRPWAARRRQTHRARGRSIARSSASPHGSGSSGGATEEGGITGGGSEGGDSPVTLGPKAGNAAGPSGNAPVTSGNVPSRTPSATGKGGITGEAPGERRDSPVTLGPKAGNAARSSGNGPASLAATITCQSRAVCG